MSSVVDELRTVPLFEGLPDEDLERLCNGVERVSLANGEALFAEGDDGDAAYVIRTGELEIIKVTEDREVLLAVREQGEVIGEMALLDAAPRMASARARGEVTLLAIPKAQMDELLATSPTAARSLFAGLLARWRQTESQLRQSERMAQLGTLTAGLAHELNNPAAAVRRGSEELLQAVTGVTVAMGDLRAAGIDTESQEIMNHLAAARPASLPLSPMDLMDREEGFEDIFEDAGIGAASDIAAELAPTDVTFDQAKDVISSLGPVNGGLLLHACARAAAANELIYSVQQAATRLSEIVSALKSYSYLDQAPLQEIDVRRGIEDTILILRHKLDGIEVVKDFDEDLPHIEAYASELNQVWTNLIDNAADALHESDGGTITIRSRLDDRDDEMIAIEIEDDGPGIPENLQRRVFDTFFTTKPPGSGTGLGLDISYNIVVHKHRGVIDLESVPGRTVFRVSLPIQGA